MRHPFALAVAMCVASSGCSLSAPVHQPIAAAVDNSGIPQAVVVPVGISLTPRKTRGEGVWVTVAETNITNEPRSVNCNGAGENEEIGFFVYDIDKEQWLLKDGCQHVPNYFLLKANRHFWHPRVFGGGDERPAYLAPGATHSHDYLLNKTFGVNNTDSYSVYVGDPDGSSLFAYCVVRHG